MATTDPLFAFTAANAISAASWEFVAFTGGGTTTPALGATVWGDTSDVNGVLEYVELTSGTWGAGTAAGFMLLSNVTTALGWTSGEDFTFNSTTAANHGTFTALPVSAAATLEVRNGVLVHKFDDTSNQVAIFPMPILHRNYDGGGITVSHKIEGAATTGDMSIHGFFKSISDDADNLTVAGTDPSGLAVFAAPQVNAAIDAPSALGEVTYDEIPFTDGAQIASLAVGEMGFYMLMRDAQDATADDMAGDMWLHGIDGRET